MSKLSSNELTIFPKLRKKEMSFCSQSAFFLTSKMKSLSLRHVSRMRLKPTNRNCNNVSSEKCRRRQQQQQQIHVLRFSCYMIQAHVTTTIIRYRILLPFLVLKSLSKTRSRRQIRRGDIKWIIPHSWHYICKFSYEMLEYIFRNVFFPFS